MSPQNEPELWSPGTADWGSGPMKTTTIEVISELNALKPMTGHEKGLAVICIALAENIDAGNKKQRAIGNEARELAGMLQLLAGVEAEAVNDADMPPEVKAFMDALGAPL